MGNPKLFSTILHQSFSNKYLHFFLIFAEYCLIFLPSSLNYSKKALVIFNASIVPESNMNSYIAINYFNKFKLSLVSPLPLSMTVIAMVFLSIYYLFFFLHTESPNSKEINGKLYHVISIIYVNVIEIFLFRYCSFLFIDNLVFMIVKCFNQNNFIYGFPAIIFIVFMLIYFLSILKYICSYALIFSIKNEQMTNCFPMYSFTSSTIETDIYALLIKMLISLENNYCHLYSFTRYSIGSFVNILCVLLYIILPIKIILTHYFREFKAVWPWFNKELNILRYFLIIFHLLLTMSVLIFSDTFTIQLKTIEYIIYIIGSLLGALFGVLLLNEKMNKTILNGDINANKIIFLITQELDHVSTRNDLFTKIYNNMISNHFLKCKNGCGFCKYHSVKIKESKEVTKPFYSHSQSLNHYMINMLKQIKMRSLVLKINDISSNTNLQNNNLLFELLELFYYRLKRKIFNFFSHYSILKHRYRHAKKVSLIFDNLDFMISCFYQENEYQEKDKLFLKEILMFSNSNKMIYEVISPLQEYVLSINLRNHPEKLVLLSDQLSDSRQKVLNLLMKFEKKDNPYNENSKKALRNILSYELVITRFIFETLFNEPFKEISPFDIEVYEEYLTFHFNHDKTLVLTVSFPKKAKEMIDFKILKFTGKIHKKENKVLSDYFPKYIRREGYDILKKTLFSVKHYNKKPSFKFNASTSANDSLPMGSFQFLLQNNYYLEYFYYEYYLSPQIIQFSHSLMLYGFYSNDYSNLLFIEKNSEKDYLLGFSKDVKNILCFKASWILILFKYKMIIHLSDLFTSIKEIKWTTTKDKSSQSNIEYDCELLYSKYRKKVMEYLNFLNDLDEIKGVEKEQKALTKARQKIKEKLHLVCKFRMKQLFSITPTKVVFCLIGFDHVLMEGLKDSVVNAKLNQYSLIQYQTVNPSTSSVADISSKKFYNPLSQFNDGKKSKENNMYSHSERNKMKYYSILTIVLSLSLIATCFIFLIIEVDITNKLKNITSLFIQYKTFKLSLGSLYMTFGSTICYTKSKEDETCKKNQLMGHSELFHQLYGLSPELSFEEYLKFEMKNKTVLMQNILAKIKKNMYDINEQDLLNILSYKVNYSSLEFKNITQINQIETEITFEDAIRISLNTFAMISNEDYLTAPYYFITMNENYRFEFDNLNNKKLTQLEVNIYKTVMNFCKLEYLFRVGQTVILVKFENYRGLNINYLIVFMVIAFVLDFVLFLLSRTNILIGYHLFHEIISKINLEMKDPETKSHMECKLSNLMSLSFCYLNDPNKIISNIKNQQSKYNTNVLKKKKRDTFSQLKSESKMSLLNNNSSRKSAIEEKIQKKRYNENFFSIISKFLNLNLYLFLTYFSFVIIFDIVLITDFDQVFKIFQYILYNCNLENFFYNDMVFSHLIFQINTTEVNLNPFVYEKDQGDNLINFYLMQTFDYYKFTKKFNTKNSKNYPCLSCFFEYDCLKIIEKIDDPHFKELERITNKKYTRLPAFICEHFKLLSLHNFDFLYQDLITRIQSLFYNYKGKNTYNDLASFSWDNDTLDIYIIELFFLKPLRRYYTVSVLTPLIQFKFEEYKIFVIIFFVINSLFECIIFMVIKWLIVEKLKKIQNNLFLLKKMI